MFCLDEAIIFDNDISNGEPYLVNLLDGRLYHLNKTAEIIITAIVEKLEIDEIQDLVYRTTLGEKEIINNDVTNFINTLLEKNIIIEQ